MSVFLSKNNIKPYNILSDLRKDDSVEITQASNTVIENEEYLYVIFNEQNYTSIEIRVENENSSGVSLYISPVDTIGNPTHWGKLITLNNIDATVQDIKVMIKYKWSVINNIYLLKRLEVSGNINIYEV